MIAMELATRPFTKALLAKVGRLKAFEIGADMGDPFLGMAWAGIFLNVGGAVVKHIYSK
jgi:hypothetical protein